MSNIKEAYRLYYNDTQLVTSETPGEVVDLLLSSLRLKPIVYVEGSVYEGKPNKYLLRWEIEDALSNKEFGDE